MDPNHYRFRSVWILGAPADAVYFALRELSEYPRWWPEVRSVTQIDRDTAELRCRSTLPYELLFTTHRSREDGAAGVLEATMEGDLAGFSRWTISSRGVDAAEAVFDEQVTARKALLRRTALIARPAFVANHSLMMRHGQRGLRTYLAGMAFAARCATAG